MSKYGQEYGMAVEVKVEKNIIVSVKDITNTDASKNLQTYKSVLDGKEAAEATYHEWHTVSAGWEDYFKENYGWLTGNYGQSYEGKDEDIPAPEETAVHSYGWTNKNADDWTSHTSWLLQQYVGWSVADIKAITVYTDYGYTTVTSGSGTAQVVDKNSKGEPYAVDYNAELKASELLKTGATQGSGRLLLAVQNALSK